MTRVYKNFKSLKAGDYVRYTASIHYKNESTLVGRQRKVARVVEDTGAGDSHAKVRFAEEQRVFCLPKMLLRKLSPLEALAASITN